MMCKSKNNNRLKSQIGLQVWRTWIIMVWISVGLGKVLEYESFIYRLGYYELKQCKI